MTDVAAEVAAWQAIQDAQLAARSDPYTVTQDRADRIANAPSCDIPGIRNRTTSGGRGGAWTGEWTRPLARPHGTVLYVHGANSYGSSRSYRRLTSQICVAAQAYVYALDYQRPPETLYDAPLRNLLEAIHWMSATTHPVLTLACDSFGATPALAAAIRLRGEGFPRLRGIYMICPKVDYSKTPVRPRANPDPDQCEAREAQYGYFGDVAADDLRASPYNDDLTGLPPILIHDSTGDNPAILAGARLLRDKLIASGNACTYREWDQVPHIWPYYGDAFTYTAEAMADAGAWLKARMR